MSNIITKNKNTFNKICSNLQRSASKFSLNGELNERYYPEKDISVLITMKYTLKGKKVYPLEDNGFVYILWEPDDISCTELDVSNSDVSNQDIAEILLSNWFKEGSYYLRYYQTQLDSLLANTGHNSNDLIDTNINTSLSKKEKIDIIHKTEAYNKIIDIVNYYETMKPVIELDDAVHKKLKKTRNAIPIMFYSIEQGWISYADSSMWYHDTNAPMTNKNRSTSNLMSMMSANQGVFDKAMQYTPYHKWLRIKCAKYNDSNNTLSGHVNIKY